MPASSSGAEISRSGPIRIDGPEVQSNSWHSVRAQAGKEGHGEDTAEMALTVTRRGL